METWGTKHLRDTMDDKIALQSSSDSQTGLGEVTIFDQQTRAEVFSWVSSAVISLIIAPHETQSSDADATNKLRRKKTQTIK